MVFYSKHNVLVKIKLFKNLLENAHLIKLRLSKKILIKNYLKNFRIILMIISNGNGFKFQKIHLNVWMEEVKIIYLVYPVVI